VCSCTSFYPKPLDVEKTFVQIDRDRVARFVRDVLPVGNTYRLPVTLGKLFTIDRFE